LTAVKYARCGAASNGGVAARGLREECRREGHAIMARPTPNPPDDAQNGPPAPPREEPVPFMQQVLDNPFLLLFLGVTIPTVFYLMWGVMEIANIPIAK
jgi:hypothetical protein